MVRESHSLCILLVPKVVLERAVERTLQAWRAVRVMVVCRIHLGLKAGLAKVVYRNHQELTEVLGRVADRNHRELKGVLVMVADHSLQGQKVARGKVFCHSPVLIALVHTHLDPD